MEPRQPLLRQAETDGTGPMKRRRPALSCVECRKRKVKCDRNKPCGPCTRMKSATCTFRLHPRAGDQINLHSLGAVVNAGAVHDYGDGLDNQHDASATSSGRGTQESASDVGETRRSKDTVEELVDRVKYLEEKLTALASQESEHASGTRVLPQRNARQEAEPARRIIKSKFYGQSHWHNCVEPYSSLGTPLIVVNPDTNRTEINKTSELYLTVSECKTMARTIKASRMVPHPPISAEIQESIPSKEICDQLVDGYIRTFECIFRVLHIPSFLSDYEAYWNGPQPAKPSTLHQILLVCAIGLPFYTGPEQPRLRVSCTKWVQAAESWLSALYQKSRLNLAGLQMQILLLQARQVSNIDGDMVWISGGTLLRSAMHLGLHREPSRFDKMSVFHREMRRRLWATVMEMTVQSSLDIGMPSMISTEDYDTLPPSNVDDADISAAGVSTALEPLPLSTFTQSWVPIALYETLPLRLDITRRINSLHSMPSYDETLRLGSTLLTAHRQKSANLHALLSSASPTPKPNAFQAKVFDVLVRRFFLCLHRPYFDRALADPKYYYSRKVCLDTAISHVSIDPSADDDWTHLIRRAVGFIRSYCLHAASVAYIELTTELADARDALPGAPITLNPQLQACRALLVNARDLTAQRLRRGETNCKGYVWLACTVARVDALVGGADPEAAVLATAKAAVEDARGIMREAYFAEHGVQLELGGKSRSAFVGRENARGSGADDVTASPADAGATGGGMAGDGWVGGDMDWERLMVDERLDFGWGFEGSPESWFGWGEGMFGM